MRVKILRILLFWVFLPLVILRHIFRKAKEIDFGHDAIKRRMSKPFSGKKVRRNKPDPKELDELLNRDISTENIL